MLINYSLQKKNINSLPKIISLFAGVLFGQTSIVVLLPVDLDNLTTFFLVPILSTLLGFLIGYYFGSIISGLCKCVINLSEKADEYIEK